MMNKYDEKIVRFWKSDSSEKKVITGRTLPVAYKDHGSEKWRWGELGITCEKRERTNMVCKRLKSIGHLTENGDRMIRAQDKKVLVIPYIECNLIEINPALFEAARTIIMNGSVEQFNVTTDGDVYEQITKNFWFYGYLELFDGRLSNLEKVRIPHNTDHAILTNPTHVIDLHSLSQRGGIAGLGMNTQFL